MYLQLFESTKLTKGISNSIIYDTQNGFLQVIPNILYELLSNRLVDYKTMEKELDNDDFITLNEYLKFVTNNKLGLLIETIEELERFENTKERYISNPTHLDYCILDLNSEMSLSDNWINQIENVKIKFLQIRIYDNLKVEQIKNILISLQNYNNSPINEISIVIKYNIELLNFIKDSKNITNKYLQIIFHSATVNEQQNYGAIQILLMNKQVQMPTGCGIVDVKNINLNNIFNNESHHHNSCLHKKISIDIDGNIRNCPSMPQSFGNIKDTRLEEALAHKDFKKYWNITKDEVEVCKDCEFRYICTDCRAYTDRTHISKDGIDRSKPLKCGYNPYTGEWAEWSTNPLKQKAIQYYGMQELVKNNEK